jgi:glycine/D-amino acid oxidase-like deaminating enzyme
MRYVEFVEGARQTPYWWDATPRPDYSQAQLPSHVDVAIIGSGYTGLMAAITLARRGLSVLVLEAQEVGFGASSRNTGMLGPSFPKRTMQELVGRYGSEKARAIVRECLASLRYCTELIKNEGIDCSLSQVGRFRGALHSKVYETLCRQADVLRAQFELDVHVVPRAEQHAEIGSDLYHGGLVLENDYSLDPARYHQGLLRLAIGAGVSIVSRTPATAVVRDGNDVKITTPRKVVFARNVIVATNAYTGSITPYLRRRIIPLQSTVIATEALPPEIMDRLMPKRRMVEEARRVFYYYRSTPDGRRMIFGGRSVRSGDRSNLNSAALYAGMIKIFPELEGARVEHTWSCNVAYTFDFLPHLGEIDGLHYALGYCGSGIAKSTWFGMKIALKILDESTGCSAFDDIRFQTRPLYRGTPWFAEPVIAWHRLCDRVGI